jgi:hypothetical protein
MAAVTISGTTIKTLDLQADIGTVSITYLALGSGTKLISLGTQ